MRVESFKGMRTKLQDKIAKYINKNADLRSWENVREHLSKYTYLLLLSLIGYELTKDNSLDVMRDYFVDNNLESADILKYVMEIQDAQSFVSEIVGLISSDEEVDINNIYQGLLASDYKLYKERFVFIGGKTNRDALGSYYTEENFAKEITNKAVEDYLKTSSNRVIRIADYSCGGGAFLLAAVKKCKELGFKVELYGYDVDPIAVLITRYRVFAELEKGSYVIELGNPLLRVENRSDNLLRFKTALVNRFYNENMSISLVDNVDIVLGNPPWEKIRFEEKKFVKHYSGDVAVESKAEREVFLKGISGENRQYYESIQQDYAIAKRRIKKDYSFKYSTAGEINTYALFTELSLNALSEDGVVGLIVKSSLLKMPVYSRFFAYLKKHNKIYDIYMFVNRKKIFDIDSREEFSVVYLGNSGTKGIGITLNLDEYEHFTTKEKIFISPQIVNKLNPATGMIPNIHNREELAFLMSIYEKNKTFDEIYDECQFGRLVHLTNHSENISKNEDTGYLPIYEGKFIEIYDAKYATFRGVSGANKYKSKSAARIIDHTHEDECPEARFFVEKDTWNRISQNFRDDYIIAWRSLTSATNRRTMLATALPLVPTCQSIQLLQDSKERLCHILAVFNSIVFDYMIRLKMAGLDLTQTVIKQMPMPDEVKYKEIYLFEGVEASFEAHINSRMKVLYDNDSRMKNLFTGIDTYEIKGHNRKRIISEIDKLVAQLYGLEEKQLRIIASTFNKYYERDEIEEFF